MNTLTFSSHSTTGWKAILRTVIVLCGVMAVLLPQQAAAQAKQTTVYLFGFAASFNDSIVYLTDIQKFDNAWVTTKHKRLMERDQYSYQLRDNLRAKGRKTPTCITFYALDIKDIAKKYAKIQERYTTKAKGNYILKNLSREEFTYKFVTPLDHSYADEEALPTKKQKAGKKAKGD